VMGVLTVRCRTLPRP